MLYQTYSDIKKCKCSNATELTDGNDIYYIGAKKTNNGIMKRVAYNGNIVSRGGGIIFICDGQGSVGYSNYMPHDFIGSTTLSIGYNKRLNKYNALFVVTILDLERFRYSFGRKYHRSLTKATIKLPVRNGEPDFDFMENYIKSLPYSANL